MRDCEAWRCLLSPAAVFILSIFGLVANGNCQKQLNSKSDSSDRPQSLFAELDGSKTFFKLQRDGKRILPVVEGDAKEFEELAKKFREIAGASTSGTSNSSRAWMKSFSGVRLTGMFAAGDISSYAGLFGFAKLPVDGFAVQIVETQEPFAKLDAKADFESGEIDVRFSRQSDGFLFRFLQSKTGELLVQQISGVDVFSETAPDFVTFQQKYGEKLNGSIADVLRYLRIEPPDSKYGKVVVGQVLDRLRPIDPQVEKEFQKIVDDLTVGKFAEREEKTKKLLEEYTKWKKYIHSAADDDEVPAETRLRLRKIISKAASETQKQEFELLLSSKLEEDPGYLIWLLGNDIVPLADADRQLTFKALRKISKQNLGDDLASWQSWVEKEFPPAPVRDFSKFDSEVSLNADGPLNELVAPVKNLLQLKLADSGLEIDSAKWAKLYDNKSTSELIGELRQHLKKKNLPASWLQVGQFYSQASTAYPQLLFENIRVAADQMGDKETVGQHMFRRSRGSRRIATNSRNRMFVSKSIHGRLLMHPVLPLEQRKLIVQRGRVVNPPELARKDETEAVEEQFLRLHLTESTEPNRSLTFSTDGGFSEDGQEFLIRVEAGSINGFLRLTGAKSEDGEYVCRLVDVRGRDVFVAQAKSLKELQEKNSDYFASELKPILNGLGVQW